MPPRTQIDVFADLGQVRSYDIVMAKKNDRDSCTVDPITNCWHFSGSVNSSGYGQGQTAHPCYPTPTDMCCAIDLHQEKRGPRAPWEVSTDGLPTPHCCLRCFSWSEPSTRHRCQSPLRLPQLLQPRPPSVRIATTQQQSQGLRGPGVLPAPRPPHRQSLPPYSEMHTTP